ncbi:MAG: hypothetical protein IJJ42_06035 [Clostridia bacterium]|nr:hypothetical protein [Clostridia bacterium]
MKKTWSLILILLLTLCLAAGTAENAGEVEEKWETETGTESVNESEWDFMDNNRVFYEIFVGSFSDSDGDGIGDLRGVINRLDYLNDGDPESGKSLGIEGIWLTPVFPSPTYHKYDVTDYYAVDPQFGTMADLEELIAGCHARGIKLILDLPLNHTGAQCRWYKNFLNAHLMQNPGNAYYDFYTWLPGEEKAPAGRHFTRANSGKLLVEANFSDTMPELNFDNPQVREEVLKIARFWLEKGVDGFRFDAAKYLYLGDEPKNVEFWIWYMEELKKIRPELYTVAEVWDGEGVTDRYAAALDCFNFSTSQAEGLIAVTAKGGDANKWASYLEARQKTLRGIRPDSMLQLFVSNHDMDRSAGYLTAASGRMKMAANLYLLAPGSPFIYYGEEINLRGSRGGANTDANRRLAMLWGDGDTVKDPAGSTYDKQTPYSVKDLLGMPGNLIDYYRQVIAIRKAHPEIARGEVKALSFPDTKLGGFLCTWEGSTAAVFHNPGSSSQTVDLAGAADFTFTAVADFIGGPEARVELNGTLLTLGPQTSAVLR